MFSAVALALSDFLSSIVVEHILFFHGPLQLGVAPPYSTREDICYLMFV